MDIVAVILEPIMSEGGDLEISGDYARRLQALCKERGMYFIVDEVQTCTALTGKYWGHEHWDLPEAPDYVTFAKKMLSCGVYYKDESKLRHGYRHFNTFFGDPVRAILTQYLNKYVKEDNLLDLVNETGDFLRQGLQELSKKHPTLIQNVRGKGTFLAFDSDTAAQRDEFLWKLRAEHGVIQGFCGDKSSRLRTSLYFEKKHAEVYLDRLDKACSSV